MSTQSQSVDSYFVQKSNLIINRIQTALAEKNMSQKELAERLGKQPSEVSKLLSIGHNPTLATLVKIEQTLGIEILNKRDNDDTSKEIKRLEKILGIYLPPYPVERVYLFGSLARAEQQDHSDIDLYLEKNGPLGLLKLARMQRELSTLTGRKVDLVLAGSAHDFIEKALDNDKILVYG